MNWYNFWQNYRIIDINTNEDLLYQAGKTINKNPITKDQFNSIINDIEKNLSLKSTDRLLDLCCGNGIITYELSKIVKKVIGIDFSKPLIKNAIKYKNNNNIEYIQYDIRLINKLANKLKDSNINKFLMYGGLAYFNPKELDTLLKELQKINSSQIKIMLGSVLDREKKSRFYNTFPRKMNYLIKVKFLQNDKGIGRWWTIEEIKQISKNNKLRCNIIQQNPNLHTSHYRIDVLIEGTSQ